MRINLCSDIDVTLTFICYYGNMQVMIIITDGKSDDDINTANAANKARSYGITVFSVGIGSFDDTELLEMSSKPDCTHVFTVNDFFFIVLTMHIFFFHLERVLAVLLQV